jgi:DNA-binding PadR family transcriptional regulator
MGHTHHRGDPASSGTDHVQHDQDHEHHQPWPQAEDDWPVGGRRARRWPDDGRPGRRGSRRGPRGAGGPWFGGPRFGGGRRPRGDVRAAILALLAEQPMHGYQVMQEIAERSGGQWQPSPGSVYPTLQALEDEDLVRATETDGKRVYELTEAGRQHVTELGDRAVAPWDLGADADGLRDLAQQMSQLAAAFHQVIRAGSPAQQARARTVISDARRGLYQILAEDDATADPTD